MLWWKWLVLAGIGLSPLWSSRDGGGPPALVAALTPAAQEAKTAAAEPPAPAATTQEAEKAREAEQKARQQAKEARERQRKLARLERDLEVARLKRGKLELDQEHAELKRDEALARANIDLELARRRLADLKEFSIPNRIRRAELGMRYAEDGLRDAREELAQLELMYRDEQFADQTKEIVIDRARRALERAQRDFELRQGEHKNLLELTIPLELREAELGLEDKERAVVELQRTEASAKFERQIARIGSEAEIDRLEAELSDVREEIKQAAEDAAKK